MATLVGIWQRLRCRDGFLALAAVPDRAHTVLRLTRLDLAFRMYDTVNQAVAAGESNGL